MNGGRPVHTHTAPIAQRTGAQLAQLAQDVRALEQLIGRAFEARVAIDTDFLKGLQQLDYLQQSLTDLAALVPYFQDPEAHNATLDAAVRLESTRAIIDGPTRPHRSVDAGTVDLF